MSSPAIQVWLDLPYSLWFGSQSKRREKDEDSS